jgi:hypothetical protein
MTRRMIDAIKRTFGDFYLEPTVHFHQAHVNHPEVCHDSRCARPRL